MSHYGMSGGQLRARTILDSARIVQRLGPDSFSRSPTRLEPLTLDVLYGAEVQDVGPDSSILPPLLRGGHCYERPGVGCRHGTGVGTNLTMASATATGLSTGTHVLAPGTETSVAQGNSDASRRAPVIGKKSHDSPQISRTGRSNRGIASAASRRSCGRKPAMAATRSPATR